MGFIIIITFSVGLFSVLTNGILLLILFFDPLKKFRTSTSFCIISLAFSDLLTGAAGFWYGFQRKNDKHLLYSILWSTIISSFGMIFLMSWERLLIVIYPLRAKAIITRTKVFIAIAFNWGISAIVGGLIYYYYGTGQPFFRLVFCCFTCILFLVLILCGIYFIIMRKASKRQKIFRESRISATRSMQRLERRLTGVLLLLVITLLLTVIPYVASSVVYSSIHIFGDGKAPPGLDKFALYYFPIEMVNFAVNPLIYAWRLPTYRNSLLYYFKRTSNCKKNVGHDNGQTSIRRDHLTETLV